MDRERPVCAMSAGEFNWKLPYPIPLLHISNYNFFSNMVCHRISYLPPPSSKWVWHPLWAAPYTVKVWFLSHNYSKYTLYNLRIISQKTLLVKFCYVALRKQFTNDIWAKAIHSRETWWLPSTLTPIKTQLREQHCATQKTPTKHNCVVNNSGFLTSFLAKPLEKRWNSL